MGIIKDIHGDIEQEAVHLLDRYHDALKIEALSLTSGDVHAAEELVLQTFEDYFFSRERFDPAKGELLPWLKGIMRNLHGKATRGKATRLISYLSPDELALLGEIRANSNCTDEEILANSDSELIRKAIEALPEKSRRIIMLRCFESISFREIARLLSISEISVKHRFYYARQILARRLGKALGRPLVAIGLALAGFALLYAAAVTTGLATSPFTGTDPAPAMGTDPAPVVSSLTSQAPATGDSPQQPQPHGDSPQQSVVITDNFETNNEENTMNTKLVKSTVVKSLVAGAMLAATAPLDAIADEGKSTSDYVQDGLVAQWDGVENAGVGLHEDSPSAWVDIVGGLEIAIPEWVTVETNAFYSESSTATRTYPSISSIPGLGDNVTIEVVAERVLWRAKDNYKNLQRIMSSPYTKFGYRESSTAGVFYQMPIGTNNKLWLYTSTSGSFNVSECHTYTARVTMPRDASNTLLVDAATVPGWTREGSDGMPTDPPTNWTFFDAPRADIRIYAIRVYNRKLTDAEVTANAAVDHVRFVEGKISDNRLNSALENVSTNSANLVWSMVTSADPAPTVTARFVSGREPDLSDGVARDLGTFPANSVVTSAVTFARYATTYWRLEAEDSNGKSYVLATKTVPAFSLDSTSYVSSGLVAQWDGVENAGRGLHDDSAAVWRDLVAGREFALTGVTVNPDCMTFAGSASSYGELSAADTLATFTANNSGTLEIAYASSRGTATDEVLLETPADSGLAYGLHYEAGVRCYVVPYAGSTNQRMFLFAAGTAKHTSSVRYNSGAPDSLFANGTQVPHRTDGKTSWLTEGDKTIIGTRASKEKTHFMGSIYAIRLYNRHLSDREIIGNEWVDQMRMTGTAGDNPLATLNVEFDGAGASVRKGYCCWPVPGETYTCRADYSVPNGEYQSLCVGWTRYVETSADVWEEEAHGTTCEASYLPDARCRRLVFHTANWRDIPAGYVRLDSLVANGNQLIDTGYYPNYHTYCVIDLKFTGSTYHNTGTLSIFGAPPSAGGLQFSVNFGGGANDGEVLFFWTRYNYATGGDSEICKMNSNADTVKNRNSIFIHMTDGGALYGDKLIGIKQRTEDQVQPTTFRLFGLTAPFTGYDSMTIYGTKLGERVGTDTTYQRDLVPARSTETGQRGLYDYVTGGFFTNIVENAAEDFAGDLSSAVYIDGEPARIGEPTIPYGCAEMESGWEFELAETNTVKTTGHQMHVKSIARYTYNDTTGAWTLAERTKGGKVTATYSGAPTRYVLEWAENTGFFIYLH